jgi:hypothetical protein
VGGRKRRSRPRRGGLFPPGGQRRVRCVVGGKLPGQCIQPVETVGMQLVSPLIMGRRRRPRHASPGIRAHETGM